MRCLVGVILVGLYCSITGGSSEELSAEKLAASYEKINAHLDKVVTQTDDPTALIRELDPLIEKQQAKCLKLGGKSLAKTLNLLVSISQLPSNEDYCDLFRQPNLFRKLDSGLMDDSRSREPNYHLRKVDRIIEHYAFESARKCVRSRNWPTMSQGLKQAAYDYIDKQLTHWLPKTSEIEPNMEAAERFLKAQVDQDGAIADALRQFISLKWTASSDSCNEEGFKTLLRNDLAVRGLSHLYADDYTTRFRYMRRVERVVFRFITKHYQQCGPILRNKIFAALATLDEDTYRKALGLASSYYLTTGRFHELADSANHKPINDQFTLPMMVDRAKELIKEYNSAGMIQLDAIESWNEFKIRHWVKTLVAKDAQAEVHDETSLADAEVAERKLMEMLEKHLFGPCAKYLAKMDTLIEMDEYNYYADSSYLKSSKSRFVPELSYHMARAANQACRYVHLFRSQIIHNFKTYARQALANGVFFWTQK